MTDQNAHWRALALQFDGQRMAALAHLRAMLADPVKHAEEAERFLNSAPEPGELPCYLRELIEGMSVSVDVSTGEDDAGHRYFGTVTEVMDAPDDKCGVTLLVQDAEPNFEAPTPRSSSECDGDVFERGESVCLLAVKKDLAEAAVRLASALTGDKYDWHYIAGRVHVKRLAAPVSKPSREVAREAFEASVRTSKLAANTPLGAVTINGEFSHYANPDTDTLWLGYRAGFNAGSAR